MPELPFGDHGPCALLSRCRACPLLPLSQSAQRDHKLKALRDLVASTPSLSRENGGLEITLSDALSSSEGYRHTAKPAVRGVISDVTRDDPLSVSSSSSREALAIGLDDLDDLVRELLHKDERADEDVRALDVLLEGREVVGVTQLLEDVPDALDRHVRLRARDSADGHIRRGE